MKRLQKCFVASENVLRLTVQDLWLSPALAVQVNNNKGSSGDAVTQTDVLFSFQTFGSPVENVLGELGECIFFDDDADALSFAGVESDGEAEVVEEESVVRLILAAADFGVVPITEAVDFEVYFCRGCLPH